MSSGVGTSSPSDAATWSRGSQLLADAGFTHAFCHLGRPDDAASCAAVAPGSALQQARQVHGTTVVLASGWTADAAPEADALISADPSLACAVRTADCAPVLVACRATGAVAAIHAGWRGIAGGVILATVDAMVRDLGAVPGAMLAAVGPCARACHYEIGEEVASALTDAGCADALVRHQGSARPFLDVACAAAMQLAASGVSPMRIDADPPCTIESMWCPSHRRDPARQDRMLSIIVPRLPTHG